MVIYEVSLAIDTDVYPQFQSWLKKHVAEMLEFPGFTLASILKPENEELSDQEKLIVHYHIENREALDHYFSEFAPKMRGEGIALFNDKFSAVRKIYEVQENISKNYTRNMYILLM